MPWRFAPSFLFLLFDGLGLLDLLLNRAWLAFIFLFLLGFLKFNRDREAVYLSLVHALNSCLCLFLRVIIDDRVVLEAS